MNNDKRKEDMRLGEGRRSWLRGSYGQIGDLKTKGIQIYVSCWVHFSATLLKKQGDKKGKVWSKPNYQLGKKLGLFRKDRKR